MSTAAREQFGPRYGVAREYVDILISRGIDWGLVGPREATRVWDRHILNSVAIAPLIPVGHRVADVGSGAGLPGMPLAILRPDLVVTCIEPLLKRANFLEQAIAELGLEARVTVVRARAEDLVRSDRPTFQTVTSRALAPLGRLLGWCAPLLSPDGRIVAIKGRSASDELARDRGDVDRLKLAVEVVECPVPGSEESTYAVVAARRP